MELRMYIYKNGSGFSCHNCLAQYYSRVTIERNSVAHRDHNSEPSELHGLVHFEQSGCMLAKLNGFRRIRTKYGGKAGGDWS